MKAAVAVIACAIVAVSFADVNTVVSEEEFTQLSVTAEEACDVDVSKCFAASRKYAAPQWKKPVVDYSTSYATMCAPEQKVKVAAKEKVTKKEGNNKELCSKNEKNQKAMEKKVKLGKKKEAVEKQVAEGKEKYLEKKVKSAQELTVKTAKKGQEESSKASEKSNKAEDNLYKKECSSKEAGFKSVREARQKVRVVYMPEVAAAPAKKKKVVKKKVVKKVVEPVPAPAPVVVKPAPAPAPKKVVIKKIVKTIVKKAKKHLLSEVLEKTTEKEQKAEAKSSESVTKANLKGEEGVAKESIVKAHPRHHGEIETKKLEVVAEISAKKAEGQELKGKGELRTKVAIAKVKEEGHAKEGKNKQLAPVVKKEKCSPESSLEKYVKGCKLREEKFMKSKVANAAALKEVKKKASEKEESIKCDITHNLCREIYKESSVREEKVAEMVADHDKELRAAMQKTENFESEEASKMKYNICKSAAADMSYFAKKFLYGVGA